MKRAHVFLVLGALALGCGEDNNRPTPVDSGEEEETVECRDALQCRSGLTLKFPEELLATEYELRVRLDQEMQQCTAALTDVAPADSDTGIWTWNVDCNEPWEWNRLEGGTITEGERSRTRAAGQAPSGTLLYVSGTPAVLEIEVSRRGEALFTLDAEPSYKSHTYGESPCEQTCEQASPVEFETLDLPSVGGAGGAGGMGGALR